MKEVLDSTKYVTERSSHVRIDKAAVKHFAEKVAAGIGGVPPWDCHYHYCGDVEQTVSYLLVLDTLNFCFWAPVGEERWATGFASERVSGYVGLAAALKMAVASGAPIADAGFLRDMTAEMLKSLLGGEGTLPLLDKRLDALNALGQLLLSEYSGRAVNLVEAAANSAVGLARLLAEKLTSFAKPIRGRSPAPLASLSLDLDNKWCFMQTNGDSAWNNFPSFLRQCVPRITTFLQDRNLIPQLLF